MRRFISLLLVLCMVPLLVQVPCVRAVETESSGATTVVEQSALPRVILGTHWDITTKITGNSTITTTKTPEISGVITGSGDLYVWGRNDFGQAGNASLEDQCTPVKILSNVSDAVLGYHCGAITTNGDLYMWGNDSIGQLGDGLDSIDEKSTPVKVMSNVASVSVGENHTVALDKNGDLYVWGSNEKGQIGIDDDTIDDVVVPYKIKLPDGNGGYLKFSYCYASGNRTYAVTQTGKMYGWGENVLGYLGVNDSENSFIYKPRQIYEHNVVKILTTQYNGACITADGRLSLWGNNRNAGFITETATQRYTSPVSYSLSTKDVAFGAFHIATLTTGGNMYTQGSNTNGECGFATNSWYGKKTVVLRGVKQIGAGLYHTAALTNNGELYVWGSNSRGQIGNGLSKSTEQITPYKVMDNVASIAVSAYNVAAVDNRGNIYIWGANASGQCTNGTLGGTCDTPVALTMFAIPSATTMISAVCGNNGIHIKWNEAEDSTKYALYRSQDGKNYSKLADVNGCEYVDTNVKFGTKYYYRISCYNAVGDLGDASDTVSAVFIVSPDKPYKVANTVSGVHVYWKTVAGAGKYGVWRSETGKNGTYKWIANPTVPHFTDTKVESGKTYYYKITTLETNTNTHSDKSEAIGITYVSTPDITSRFNKAAGITLGWNKITGATGYAIYRKSYSGNDAWVRVATVSGNKTFTWQDTSVKNANGIVYRYTIRALAGADMKTLSGCRNTGRTMARLTSRTLSSAVKASATSIKCSWTTSSAVTGYEVRFMIGDTVYKTFTVGNYKTGVKTFTGLKAGQPYKIQVRSYLKVDSMGFYSAWSEPKNVKLP